MLAMISFGSALWLQMVSLFLVKSAKSKPAPLIFWLHAVVAFMARTVWVYQSLFTAHIPAWSKSAEIVIHGLCFSPFSVSALVKNDNTCWKKTRFFSTCWSIQELLRETRQDKYLSFNFLAGRRNRFGCHLLMNIVSEYFKLPIILRTDV